LKLAAMTLNGFEVSSEVHLERAPVIVTSARPFPSMLTTRFIVPVGSTRSSW
jgi:hypothetical protein